MGQQPDLHRKWEVVMQAYTQFCPAANICSPIKLQHSKRHTWNLFNTFLKGARVQNYASITPTWLSSMVITQWARTNLSRALQPELKFPVEFGIHPTSPHVNTCVNRSNETFFTQTGYLGLPNKNRNKSQTSNTCIYIHSSLCCISALSGLWMQVHCIGGQRLVSVLLWQ